MNNEADDHALSDLEAGQQLFGILLAAATDIGPRLVSSACISFLSLTISRSATDVQVRDDAIEAVGMDIRNGFIIYDKVAREGLN